MNKKWIGLFLLLAFANISAAQMVEKEVLTQRQLWFGYMSSQRFSNKFSLWNDVHFVPNGFFVLRTGLTYHFPEKVSITAGYGYLGLPAGITKDLKRPEHRPWAQMVVSTPLGPDWSFLFRFRYDARFRKQIEDFEIVKGFGFNHRFRFMANLRKNFPALKFGRNFVPFLALADEIHLNAGKEIIFNALDQNRITAAVGIRGETLQLQTGYMNRYVQLISGNKFVMNHTMVLWVTHRMDFRQKEN